MWAATDAVLSLRKRLEAFVSTSFFDLGPSRRRAGSGMDSFVESTGRRTEAQLKMAAIFGIFFVSLFAVSFPSVSKRSSLLRIPHVAFFIGKHYGTGTRSQNACSMILLTVGRCHSFDGVLPSITGLF
jgi:hypothetical protein